MVVSEVTRLRETIQAEYIAAQRALHDPAMVGKHAFITKHMENMQNAHTELQAIVGVKAAIKLLSESLDNLPEMGGSDEPLR